MAASKKVEFVDLIVKRPGGFRARTGGTDELGNAETELVKPGGSIRLPQTRQTLDYIEAGDLAFPEEKRSAAPVGGDSNTADRAVS